MPLYRSLAPLSYTAGNRVINIIRSGIIFSAPEFQVAGLDEELYEYVGSGDSYIAPRATFMVYNGLADLPLHGSPYHVYLDHFTGQAYRWSESDRAYHGIIGNDAVADMVTEDIESRGEGLIPGDTPGTVRKTWGDAVSGEFPANAVLVEGIADAGEVGKLSIKAETAQDGRASIGALGSEDIVDEIALALAEDESVATAAAGYAAEGVGTLAAIRAPELARNRVPNPQIKGGPVSNLNPTAYAAAETTTGLPTGFSYGGQVTRQGSNSSGIGQVLCGSTEGANANAIPVTEGEKISASIYVWSDDPASKNALCRLFFYDESDAQVGGSVSGSNTSLVSSAWELRKCENVTVPATATHMIVMGLVTAASGSSTTGSVTKATGGMVKTGSTVGDYADGYSALWSWLGTPHASVSVQVWRSVEDQEAMISEVGKADAVRSDLTPAITANTEELATINARLGKSAAERAYRRQTSVFTLPAGFTWAGPEMLILTDGLSYWTTYDAETRKNAGGATVYWDSVAGNDTTGDGTEGNPYQTFTKCQAEALSGDTIVLLNTGVTWRGPAPSGISKSLNIIAAYPGESILACADLLSWSATSGRPGVYEADRTNVRQVVDIELDPDGITYTRAADLDECEATPMSWYQATDGTGLVYVHNMDGTSPDPQTVLALLSDSIFDVSVRFNDQNLYVEGLRVFGSNDGIQVVADTSDTLTFTSKNCAFLHGGYGGVGGTNATNGLSVVGNVDFFAQDTTVAYGAYDGFNYHDTGAYIPTFVELNCVAHDCGNQPNTGSVAATMNASTAHDGVKGIRIGGKYHHTFGGMVTDVQTDTKTVNLSCDAWNSLASSGSGYNRGFAAGQPSDPNAEMWLYGCRAWGNIADLYADTGTTMHVINTEYETSSGTLDIVS